MVSKQELIRFRCIIILLFTCIFVRLYSSSILNLTTDIPCWYRIAPAHHSQRFNYIFHTFLFGVLSISSILSPYLLSSAFLLDICNFFYFPHQLNNIWYNLSKCHPQLLLRVRPRRGLRHLILISIQSRPHSRVLCRPKYGSKLTPYEVLELRIISSFLR